jgi:hypothetical protein
MYWHRFAGELRRGPKGERGEEEETRGGEEGGKEGGREGETEKEGVGSRALILSFTLPPSTYATMLLRELMKVSTTAHEMKKLNEPGPSPTSRPPSIPSSGHTPEKVPEVSEPALKGRKGDVEGGNGEEGDWVMVGAGGEAESEV